MSAPVVLAVIHLDDDVLPVPILAFGSFVQSVTKTAVGSFTIKFRKALVHANMIPLCAFNDDSAAGNVNAFLNWVDPFTLTVTIRQGPGGTLIDLHVDILLLQADPS